MYPYPLVVVLGGYMLEQVYHYLSDLEVMDHIHSISANKSSYYSLSNMTVFDNLRKDIMIVYTDQYETILENNITMCIYEGQFDSIVNTYGVQNWLAKLRWSEMNSFYMSSRNLYYYISDDNKQIKLGGNFKQHKNLSVLIVYASGHLVPTTQLALSRNMLSDIIFNNSLLCHQKDGNCNLDTITCKFMNNCTNNGKCYQGKCICNPDYYGADCSITFENLGSKSFTLNATSWRFFSIGEGENIKLKIEATNNTLVYTRRGGIPSQSFYNSYSHGAKININVEKNTTGGYIAIFNPDLDHSIDVQMNFEVESNSTTLPITFWICVASGGIFVISCLVNLISCIGSKRRQKSVDALNETLQIEKD